LGVLEEASRPMGDTCGIRDLKECRRMPYLPMKRYFTNELDRLAAQLNIRGEQTGTRIHYDWADR
jgi:hypothetical protein